MFEFKNVLIRFAVIKKDAGGGEDAEKGLLCTVVGGSALPLHHGAKYKTKIEAPEKSPGSNPSNDSYGTRCSVLIVHIMIY